MKIDSLIVALSMLLAGMVHAQTTPLRKGDLVPDIAFEDVYNMPEGKTLSAYRGKLVILDFWGFTCASCLQSFPKIDSLQKRFADDIQIIAVSRERSDRMVPFFRSHKNVHFPDIPFVCGDSVLRKLFSGVDGGYAWIGKDGVFLFETSPYNLTAENIQAVLDGGKGKIREAVKQVYMKSLFDERIEDQVAYSSAIMRYDSKSGIRPPSTIPQGMAGIADAGTPVSLYQRAFEKQGKEEGVFFRPGRTILQVSDPSVYSAPTGLTTLEAIDWRDRHYFGYQLVVPEKDSARIHLIMQEDLARFFGLRAAVEKRKVATYVLTRTDRRDRLKTNGGSEEDSFFSADDIKSTLNTPTRVLRNKPFSVFVSRLYGNIQYRLGTPFLDKTGYEGLVDVEFTADELDDFSLEKLHKALGRYGLQLTKKNVRQEVLVLREGGDPKQ